MENSKQHEELDKSEELVSENLPEGEEIKDAEREAEDEEVMENEASPAGPQATEALKKLEGELGEMKDKYLRLYSEFENFRRRTAKEKLEMVSIANEKLVLSLLPVIDDFERAEKAFTDKENKDFEGFHLIHHKLKKVLDQAGLKTMNIEQGADFDPDMQEAITQIPAPDEKLKGKVVDVVEKGYLLNEKVIRYAKVVVGN